LWVLPRLIRQDSDLQALATLADLLMGSSSRPARSVLDDDPGPPLVEQQAGELGHPPSLGAAR
jgi:hypothetical protein